jgi:hypothetical protein
MDFYVPVDGETACAGLMVAGGDEERRGRGVALPKTAVRRHGPVRAGIPVLFPAGFFPTVLHLAFSETREYA